MKPLKKWWRASPRTTFAIVFCMFLIVGLLKLDKDFGWHFMSGNYIVHHWIPATDIFTYTAKEFHWINHEWLNDVLVYGLYSIGGQPLVALLWAVLGTAALWLVGRRYEASVVVLAAVAIAPFAGVRPLVWTLLGVATSIFFVRKQKYWWWLVPVFALWSNLHGGFLLGLVYILYKAVRLRSLHLFAVWVAAFFATALNPYGFGIYVEIFRTLTDSSLRTTISEWGAFNIIYTLWPYGLLWLIGFLLYSLKQPRDYLRFDMAMLAAGLSSVRNWPLFVIFSMGRVDRYIRRINDALPAKLDQSRRWVVQGIAAVVTILALGCFGTACYAIVQERSSFPVSAVTYLKEHPCDGQLFAYYNYGGYLIWQLPEKPVYIDGRMPSWEKPGGSYMKDYLRITTDPEFRKEQFQKYNVRCVLMPPDEMFVNQLKSDGWRVVIDQKGHTLLKR